MGFRFENYLATNQPKEPVLVTCLNKFACLSDILALKYLDIDIGSPIVANFLFTIFNLIMINIYTK